MGINDDFIRKLYEAFKGVRFKKLETLSLDGCANDDLTADSLSLLSSVHSNKIVQVRISGFDPFVLLKLYSKSHL